jgi:Putative beta-barrel porin-2, OmpL-like. bbp2
MKLNKWTLGLASCGLVSLAPAAFAQNGTSTAPTPLTTALSATTISGYVDTSAVWNPGTGNANPAPYAYNAGKQDGFNLDSALVQIQRLPDTGKWAAGYTLSVEYGANTVSASDPLRQGYVELLAPIGNGINFKIGQWDNVLGYESSDSMNDPNWSRSYGYSIEPREHVGLLAFYKFNDAISFELGVANTLDNVGIDGRNTSGGSGTDYYTGAGTSTIESKKALVSLLSLTAPDSWGWLKGSMFYAGLDYGPGNAVNHGILVDGGTEVSAGGHVVDKTHVYLGATINTPVKGLTFGASWDTVNNYDGVNPNGGTPVAYNIGGAHTAEGYAMAVDLYGSYALSDKATFSARAEYFHTTVPGFTDGITDFDGFEVPANYPQDEKILALTGTFQYQLWNNVVSRVEARWDHSANGYPQFGGTTASLPDKLNEITLAANIIYKF